MKLPIANLQPKKWWHWVTLLIIVILQSIPTLVSVVDSYKLNVPYSKVAIANEQQKLWQKNFECIKQELEAYVATTDTNDIIKVAACNQTGDIIVEVNFANGKKLAKWISFETFCCVDHTSIFGLDTVYAAEQKFKITVICQIWIDNTNLFRRVQIDDDLCYDEYIHTPTGIVKRNPNPVPCEPDDKCVNKKEK